MAASADFNLFTPAQESDLGDAIAEHLQRTIPIVHAGAQTAYLEALGARVLAHMPATAIRFRYFLVDIPTPNAFVLPGGRVYLSRKLVAFVQGEDELAGILGHEFGHVLARQGSRRISRVLRSGLGVHTVGDRADVFARYNQILDGAARTAATPSNYVDDEVAADQLSLYAIAAAGYDPAAMVAFFDRLTENSGITGGALSDFFTITRPESKRVREMVRTLSTFPAACRNTATRPAPAAFEAWRKAVAELPAVRAVASVAPVHTLTPRLHPGLRYLTFSPDGKWLVSQHESGAVLLATAPLAVRVLIPTATTHRVVFGPDSRTLHLLTPTHRLETWDLATATRQSVREVVTGTVHCAETLLAPGGRVLACRTGQNEVRLYDAASDALVASREFELDEGALPLQLAFSQDGRYFLTSPRAGTSSDPPWAYDLAKRANVAIPGPLRSQLPGGFLFGEANRLVTSRGHFAWPGGEAIPPVAPPSTGVTPLPAVFDIFQTVYAAERDPGVLALYPIGKSEPTAVVALPDSALFDVRAAAISADLNRIALANASRTGLWTLDGSQPAATLLPAAAARFLDDDRLQLHLPGQSVMLERRANGIADAWKIPEGERHLLRGPVLYQLTATGAGNKRRDSITVRDAADRSTLWQTTLPPDAAETFTGDEVVVTVFPLESKTAKQALRNPALRERLFEGRKPIGRLLQILGARDGKELGWIAIEEPAVQPQRVRVHGETVFIGDSENRVHVYNLKSGQSAGKVFGRLIAVSSDGNLLCVENESGDARVHETAKLGERARWQLDGNILAGRFDREGKRLLLVSSLQNVFIVRP